MIDLFGTVIRATNPPPAPVVAPPPVAPPPAVRPRPPVYDPDPYYPPPRGAYNPRVLSVQQALQELGYYNGPVDGVLGPSSRAAIQAYQRSYGLPITGRIDPPLLDSLDL